MSAAAAIGIALILVGAPSLRTQEPSPLAAQLDALVHDATAEERVELESAALEIATAGASSANPERARELDAAARKALEHDPASARGARFRVIGWLDELETLAANDPRETRARGRLHFDDGANAWFIAPRSAAGEPKLGAQVAFDGVFLKLYNRETSGGWLEAPLFIAAKLEPLTKGESWTQVLGVVFAIVLAMVVVFIWRLRSEARRSPELWSELGRRRRASSGAQGSGSEP